MDDGGVRTLVLPGGGTMDIPLPGSKARFTVRQGPLAFGGDGSSRFVPLVAALVVGVAVGVAATAWYYRSHA